MSVRPILRALWISQNGLCHYCGILMTKGKMRSQRVTADHITPRSQGGSDDVVNLVGACYACNQARGDAPYEDFFSRIKLGGRIEVTSPGAPPADLQNEWTARRLHKVTIRRTQSDRDKRLIAEKEKDEDVRFSSPHRV